MFAKPALLGLVLFCSPILNGSFSISTEVDTKSENHKGWQYPESLAYQDGQYQTENVLQNLNSQLLPLIVLLRDNKAGQSDLDSIVFLIYRIKKNTDSIVIESKIKSDSFYLTGVYYLLTNNLTSALSNFQESIGIREKLKISDLRLGRATYNMGKTFRELGNFQSAIESQKKALHIFTSLYGDQSIELIDPYLSMSSSYIEIHQHEIAISCLNTAMSIANTKTDSISPASIANLYDNLGASYSKLTDFVKAKIYYERALSIYNDLHINNGISYINLINSLASTYKSLGLLDKSVEYYEMGVELALEMTENSSYSFNIVNNYATTLAKSGNISKGEELIKLLIKKAAVDSVKMSQLYNQALYNYAEFLGEYKFDFNMSLVYYSLCMDYTQRNPDDLLLKSNIYTGYAQSLAQSGEYLKAIGIIQELITSSYKTEEATGDFNNPDINTIKPDLRSLNLFRTKHLVLSNLDKKSNNLKFLEASASTAELIVALLEKMRINISEDDSRLILGDRYRDAYFAAIGDYHKLYSITSDKKYLEKVFEFSEKAKVAGLLTSTRELKAIQFRIPPDIANYEFRLKNEIGVLHSRINEASFRNKPDKSVLKTLSENLLKNIRLRDSLILVIEHNFPEYYAIKYNTRVASLNDINHIVGRNGNYINYLLSDTVLYIFVANRKFKQIIATKVSSDLLKNIEKYRNLLTKPVPSEDAFASFKQYNDTGFDLYKTLIEPILPFLISERLIISPDNILSYIPFETLPSGEFSDTKQLYRSVPYVMDNFDISYTYSATFMAETDRENYGFKNKVMAFAPDYPGNIDIQSVYLSRQVQSGVLHDLPYARLEAQYVTDITGGKLYENSEASESSFKKESGNYNILHLAMHTLLNDRDQMNSALIFSAGSDTLEDRFLKTYEIYGMPLKAKMVVLSSCNTGSGILYSGEGILSLARGFIYSGSQSVVMSMWEIEDRSGTEIVKMFYSNLKKGYSKSVALRKARTKYLKNSDQLRSHPYFWSTLVVYGNNDPLYYNRYWILAAVILFIVILLTVVFYQRRRRYS